MRHDYALHDDREVKLASYVKLKGSDAVLFNVCKELQLKTSLGIVYKDDDTGVFYQKKAPIDGRTYGDDDGTMWSHLKWLGGVLLWSENETETDSEGYDSEDDSDEEESDPKASSKMPHVE